jgi:argininosuccinate lyase
VTAMKGIAAEMLGRELSKPREIWMRALDPDYFISIRKIPGGPALEAVQAQIATARKEQAETQEWRDARRALLERYPQLIRVDIGALNNAPR